MANELPKKVLDFDATPDAPVMPPVAPATLPADVTAATDEIDAMMDAPPPEQPVAPAETPADQTPPDNPPAEAPAETPAEQPKVEDDVPPPPPEQPADDVPPPEEPKSVSEEVADRHEDNVIRNRAKYEAILNGEDAYLEAIRRRIKMSIDPNSGVKEGLDLFINQILLGKRSELVTHMKKYYPDQNSLQEAEKDPDSFLSVVTDALSGWNTGDNNTIEEVLVRNDKIGERLTPQSEIKEDGLREGFPRRLRSHATRVSGKEARLLRAARMGTLLRIPLLNSGFWVAVRAPDMAELHEIFMTIDLEAKEIGRTIGLHFALIADMYVKRKFMEILIQHHLIEESNFPDIYEPGAFFRNVSYHDYETLVYAVVALMSRKGLHLKMVCPACKHVSVDEHIDVTGTKRTNLDLMTPEIRAWWNDLTAVRSEQDLLKYREQLCPFRRTVTQNFDIDGDKVKTEIDMFVPTMEEYFQVGDLLINKINNSVTAIARGEMDKDVLAKTNMTIRGYQLIAPWVREIRFYRSDDPTMVDFSFADADSIMDQLDQSIQENKEQMEGEEGLLANLNQLVADTRFNYFGSVNIKCPSCGATPESKLDGFFPIEYQTVFFGLLFRLSLAGR